MDFEEIKEQERENIMQTYGRFDVALVSGHGATARDCGGREYIDFTSGIGVNSLGYADPVWARAVAEQAARLQHTSTLYYSPVPTTLAETRCKRPGVSKVFFGTYGAEANECAIKLARKYGMETYGKHRNEIVTLINSFHGRTVTTLAATGQDEFHQNFTPLTQGFSYAEPNLESVTASLSDKTCAVMIELIQGEGGVVPLDKSFVKSLNELCKKRDILLIVDEVQTGVGRTGALYCYQNYGIVPDVVTSAKGLGGGLPIGACLCTERLGKVLGAGMHGSTFGGNPVVCAGAQAVLERVGDAAFLQAVIKKGAYLSDRLKNMNGVEQVRGMGMMLGAKPKQGSVKELAVGCVKQGLLVLTAKDVLRFLPPLTITYEEIDKGLAVLEKVLSMNHAG